jgi:hypothetical protein
MNQEETIVFLKTYKDDSRHSFDKCTINNYTIYCASLFHRTEFLAYCGNQNITFPQIILYVNLALNNLRVCEICMLCGCVLDSTCMTIACQLLQQPLIEFCMKSKLMPTENDIELLMIKADELLLYSDCEMKKDIILDTVLKMNLTDDEFIKNFMNYIFRYDIKYDSEYKLSWLREKFSKNICIKQKGFNRKTVHKMIKNIRTNIKRNRSLCIDFIKKCEYKFNEFVTFSDIIIDELIKHKIINKNNGDEQDIYNEYMDSVLLTCDRCFSWKNTNNDINMAWFRDINIIDFFDFHIDTISKKDSTQKLIEKENIKPHQLYLREKNNESSYERYELFEYYDYIIKYQVEELYYEECRYFTGAVECYYKNISDFLNNAITIIPKSKFFERISLLTNDFPLNIIIKISKSLPQGEEKFAKFINHSFIG